MIYVENFFKKFNLLHTVCIKCAHAAGKQLILLFYKLDIKLSVEIKFMHKIQATQTLTCNFISRCSCSQLAKMADFSARAHLSFRRDSNFKFS